MCSLPRKKFAFVDVKTTGISPSRDRIIELAVINWDGEVAERWSSLVNPEVEIPPFIQRLTGISQDLLRTAPAFRQVAEDFAHRLHGHVLVAHHARFDYAFLRSEFRRVGIGYRASVICTVKYARRLFSEYPDHTLGTLIARHHIDVTGRHSAMAVAHTTFEFWQAVYTCFPASPLEHLRRRLIADSSLPVHIDRDRVHQIPNTAGVYFFYGTNDLLLYVGKARQLRQRVLSHFAADHSLPKEMRISQQIRRIDWRECAGEIDALLTEARLIKTLQPTMNRQLRRNRELCTWSLEEKGGALQPRLLYASDLDFRRHSSLYGLFQNAREAKKALLAVAKEAGLCSVTLGLEKGSPGKPCFGRQLQRCRGACCGEESVSEHGQRLIESLGRLRLAAWPFRGPALLEEGDVIHVIDAWCYLGTAASEKEAFGLVKDGRRQFDRDTYRILSRYAEGMRPLRGRATQTQAGKVKAGVSFSSL